MTRPALIDAIMRAVDAADQLAAARCEVIAALGETLRIYQQTTGRREPPHLLSVRRFDAELAGLLASVGCVGPLRTHRMNLADFPDASAQRWTPRRGADSPAAFVARWRKAVAAC
jgi:hypothetical protein